MTAAVLAEPQAAEPQAQPVPPPAPPRWTLGAPPAHPGRGVADRLHFAGREASARFERDGSPAPGPPDRTPEVLDAVRRLAADRAGVVAAKQLRQKIDVLDSVVANCDTKTKELTARRNDPALLECADLGVQLHQLELAADAFAARRDETVRQKQALDGQHRRALTQLALQIDALTEAEIRRLDAAQAEKYADASRRLSAAAGPILEELHGLLQVLGRRPDATRIRTVLLREYGAAPPPPAPSQPQRVGQRRLLPMPGLPVPVGVAAAEEDDADDPEY